MMNTQDDQISFTFQYAVTVILWAVFMDRITANSKILSELIKDISSLHIYVFGAFQCKSVESSV